jgi:hypothetical protein
MISKEYKDLMLACHYKYTASVFNDEIIQEILDYLKPDSADFYNFGILSFKSSMQKRVLLEFCKSKKRYKSTYYYAASLALFSLMDDESQKNGLHVILSDRESISLPLVAALLNDKTLSSIHIAKSWLSMPDGVVFGYRHWRVIKEKIIKDANLYLNTENREFGLDSLQNEDLQLEIILEILKT